MVIAKGRDGITAFVTLGDDEFLPDNLNSKTVIVFRQGNSTDRQLVLIKPFGELGNQLLKPDPPAAPVCAMSAILQVAGRPLHQHEDLSWWFYDADFQLENGPFETEEEAQVELGKYCIDYQKTKEFLLTIEKEAAKLPESKPEEATDDNAPRQEG